VVIVTLTAGIMFLLFFACTFGYGEVYEGGPRVRRPPVKWPAIAESVRYTTLHLADGWGSGRMCQVILDLQLQRLAASPPRDEVEVPIGQADYIGPLCYASCKN
jgi:hypothetical protein